MGSSAGMVFNIAENTGLLKHKLYKAKIPFSLFSPTVVKKQFVGKGNCKKEEMSAKFKERFGVEFHKEYGGKPGDTPENDLVDAFANLEIGCISRSLDDKS